MGSGWHFSQWLTSLVFPLAHEKAFRFSTKWGQLGPTTSLLLLLHCSSFCFATPFHVSSLLLLCYSFPCFVTPPTSLLFLLLCCCPSYFDVPFCASLLLYVFCCSSSYFITPLCASLLLLLLHNSSMLPHSSYFVVPHLVLLGCCGSCLIATLCFTLLLFIVLRCYSYFDVVPCFITIHASLLLLFHYSWHFTIVWCVIIPLHFIVLLPSQVPLYPLLLHYFSVFCCCLVFHCSLT